MLSLLMSLVPVIMRFMGKLAGKVRRFSSSISLVFGVLILLILNLAYPLTDRTTMPRVILLVRSYPGFLGDHHDVCR